MHSLSAILFEMVDDILPLIRSICPVHCFDPFVKCGFVFAHTVVIIIPDDVCIELWNIVENTVFQSFEIVKGRVKGVEGEVSAERV